MSDIIQSFAIHVGTRASLPLGEQRAWHEERANFWERELRDFIAAILAELALVETNDIERRASIEALLGAHPELKASQ